MDHNLYWHAAGLNDLDGLSLEEWRAHTGQDQHSLMADPLFVDPAHEDFRLQPGSPALKLGFVPFHLRAEPGASAEMDGREGGGDVVRGPRLKVSQGQVWLREQALMSIPEGEWVHYEFRCPLGLGNPGAFDLMVTLPNGVRQEFTDLPYDRPEFRKLQRLYFQSTSRKEAVFYLDNVKVAPSN